MKLSQRKSLQQLKGLSSVNTSALNTLSSISQSLQAKPCLVIGDYELKGDDLFCSICYKFFESGRSYKCHMIRKHSDSQTSPKSKEEGINDSEIKSNISSGISEVIVSNYKNTSLSLNIQNNNIRAIDPIPPPPSPMKEDDKVFGNVLSLEPATMNIELFYNSDKKICRPLKPKNNLTLNSPTSPSSHPGEAQQPPSETLRFSCHLCPKTFKQKVHLTRHIKEHSGDKPYLCKLCNASFKRLENYNQHIQSKRHHTIQARFVSISEGVDISSEIKRIKKD